MQVLLAGLGAVAAICSLRFFKRGVGISAQHFGPLVAVVARSVATRKDVAEGVGRAVVIGRGQHRHFIAHLLEQRHVVAILGSAGVQQHVKQRKLNLAQRAHACLEVLGRNHLVVQRAGQWLASVDMRCHVAQYLPLPAEVFHELAGQLYRIPFHAVDARDIFLAHLREHVVQRVAGLVEQGDHVVVRQQRGLAIHAFGKVADHVRHGCLQQAGVGALPAAAHIVHPCATALALAGGLVQVELSDDLAVALQAVKQHILVPDGS